MTPQRLENQLNKALDIYNQEIEFMLDTFDQRRTGQKLTKQDMEDMGRQTFYLMSSFKDSIIKYLRENDR